MTAIEMLEECRAHAGEKGWRYAAGMELTRQLSGMERRAAREYYLSGKSQRQIAGELRYSYGYIRCLLYYARRHVDSISSAAGEEAIRAAKAAKPPVKIKKNGV